MLRLLTTEARTEARKTWISGRTTEIYKDLEILKTESNNRFFLTIWKGKAGNPYINYYYTTAEQRERSINFEKSSADKRAEYKSQHADNRGRVLTEAAKTSQKIKEILSREYPGIKFSVRSSNFANGNSVDVSWTDGIPEKEIEGFLNQFQSGHFDGMTDCYEYSNVRNMPQAKYVSAKRDISPEKEEIIRKQLAEKMNIENTDNAVIPADFMVNVRGYNFNAPLSALVYQISRDFDFSKCFSGVRCKKTEDNREITNMFELY